MKKKMRILFTLALFAASSVFMACRPESAGNSNNAGKSSTPIPPVSVGTPAQDDLPEKLKKLGVNDVAKPPEKKSNVEHLTEKINAYKEAYKADPAEADKNFNEALRSFTDGDVKTNLLEIKDLAVNEVVKSPAVNNSNTASEKKDVEKVVSEKINPVAEQLKIIDQKVDKNDLSRISLALLIQTLILGVLISGGYFWLFFSMRQLKLSDRDEPSYHQTGAELSAQRARADVSRDNAIPETPAVDLSKIEGNLTTLASSVDELARRVTGYETTISRKFDDYCEKLSNRPGSESRGQEQTGASRDFTPITVRDLKDKYHGRYRHLDKENFSDHLVLSHHEGTFLLTQTQRGDEVSYHIFPNKERFRNGDEYRSIEYYFDCDSAGAGELLVEKPARVREVGERWELQIRGKISIQ